MSITKLITTIKGGSGSGNFGHSGRPGKRGGSAAGTGGKFVVQSTADMKYLQEPYRKVAAEAFNFKDVKSGMAAVVEQAAGSRVVGGIYDRDGNRVGEFYRQFESKMGDPMNKITHLGFKLDDDKQATGFGARFYKHSEDAYMKHGIKTVELEANSNVGGYAWARMGFSFAHDVTAGSMAAKLQLAYAKRYGYDKLTSTQFPDTAYGIAAFAGPDGKRIGKDVLLGSQWSAIKQLDPNDIGYQVGQLYYKGKGL